MADGQRDRDNTAEVNNEVQHGAVARQLAFEPDGGVTDIWTAAAALLAGVGVRASVDVLSF